MLPACGAAVISAGVALPDARAQTGGDDPPNLIFILMDDMGYDAIKGGLGQSASVWPDAWAGVDDNSINTPNLAAFADQGVIFTNVRVNPNCSPTRGALMTGRNALATGLHGVITWQLGGSNVPEIGDPLYETSLQAHEHTIADVLSGLGYRTVLFDKWHCGYGAGQTAEDQGFDTFYWYNTFLAVDNPLLVGDEHTKLMKDLFVSDWNAHGTVPKAYFFHSIDPHRRENDGDGPGYVFWDVDPDLTDPVVYTEESYANLGPDDSGTPGRNVFRHKKVVHANDTLIRQMLAETRVVTSSGGYDSESNTIVFFVADNGTDPLVALANVFNNQNQNDAKNTTSEGGIHVPCFVFGAGISDAADGFQPKISPRLINHVDFFETICDVVGATAAQRENPNGLGNPREFERHGVSFADEINYTSTSPVPREYSVNSFGFYRGGKDLWKVVMTDGRYKLVCRGGGADFADPAGSDDTTLSYVRNFPDEFYDLQHVEGEGLNLLNESEMFSRGEMLTQEQLLVYLEMREDLVDHWPTAVSIPLDADAVPTYSISLEVPPYLLRVHVQDGQIMGCPSGGLIPDEFLVNGGPNQIYVDPDTGECTTIEEPLEPIYLNMRSQLAGMYDPSEGHPSFVTNDVPATDYLLLKDPPDQGGAQPLPGGVGHKVTYGQGVYTSTEELRTYINFQPSSWPIPTGYTLDDLHEVQLIVKFNQDGTDPDESDSGRVWAHPVTVNWSPGSYNRAELWDGFNGSSDLGSFDPLPHAVWDSNYELMQSFDFRSVPLAPGTPVSFGHSADLKSLVSGWIDGNSPQGLVLRSRIIGQNESTVLTWNTMNQQVFFMPQAYLRLTWSR